MNLLVNLLDLVGAFESIDCQFNRTAEFLRKFLWPFPLEAEVKVANQST